MTAPIVPARFNVQPWGSAFIVVARLDNNAPAAVTGEIAERETAERIARGLTTALSMLVQP